MSEDNLKAIRAAEKAISEASPIIEKIKFETKYKNEKLLEENIQLMNEINSKLIINAPNRKNKKVFVVHGHNYHMRNEVESLLKNNGLIPVVLTQQIDRGKTIIEKFENFANECSAAIVIMSADDKMKNKTIAARPNVILEMGYFMGKIGRENIIVLKQKEVSHYPSDIQGIVYKEYTKGPGEWRNQIILELKSMGF